LRLAIVAPAASRLELREGSHEIFRAHRRILDAGLDGRLAVLLAPEDPDLGGWRREHEDLASFADVLAHDLAH
jgi:hypothetical protein